MKELQTIHGETFIVDDEDYERAMQYRWTTSRSKTGRKQVISSGQKDKSRTYKQIILGTLGKFTLYKNENPMDLRRENILVFDMQSECSLVQNQIYKKREFSTKLSLAMHRRRDRKQIKNRYYGVSYISDTPLPWIAVLRKNGKKYCAGCFSEEKNAALAHDKQALEVYGPNARRNFPHLTYKELTEQLAEIKAEDGYFSMDSFSRQMQGKISPKIEGKKTSKYVGVSYSKSAKKWVVVIHRHRKHYSLGGYYKEEAAARAYDKKAIELYGENATLNFPNITKEELTKMLKQDKEEQLILYKKQRGTLSRYIGVSFSKEKKNKKWTACITHHRKVYRLGYFYTEEEAAHTYDAKAFEFLGENAKLNFPRE